MKKIIFILCILFSTLSYGQKKISVGLEISPELGNITNRNIKAKYTFVYTTGLNVGYALSTRVRLYTGLWYGQKGFAEDVTLTDANGLPIGNFRTNGIYKYIDIPLGIRLLTSDSKIAMYGDAGVIVDLITGLKEKGTKNVGSNSDTYKVSGADLRRNGFRNPNLTGMAGVGLQWKPSDVFSLSLGPVFKYTFGTAFKSYRSNFQVRNFYSIGLQVRANVYF